MTTHEKRPESPLFDAKPSAPEPAEPILRFFGYTHLPPNLAAVSRPFAELAELVHGTLPRCAERTVSLRKILEAKDAAVRARLSGEQ